MSDSPTPPEDRPGRSRQSRRGDILAAAVASVVSDGYAQTSVSQVARRAGVARPLVQYYFPTRELMLRAAIAKILDDWRDHYLASPDGSGDQADIGAGIARLWRHMHEPAYRAYRELHSAARTDAALRAIMDELDADAAHRRHDQAAATYATFAAADPTAFTDARAFTSIFLEGLLQHRFGPPEENSTAERQFAMLTGLLTQYWSQHGVVDKGRANRDTATADLADIRHQAAALVDRLQALIKTAG